MTAQPTEREMRTPAFPATVHAYTDVLRELVDGPHTPEALAQATARVASNVRRDVHKLKAAGVIEPTVDGKWALTGKGRRWVEGVDHAEGRSVAGGAELTALPSRLTPDTDQPRKVFDPAELQALADSIADKGLLQPILVRPAGPDGLHVIIAGERRWRALTRLVEAGRWHPELSVPIRVATPEDEAEAMELALVENTQRLDLNHLELAQGYQRLTDLGRTPKQIAAVVGRTNDHVTQHLRLTRLPADVQPLAADGRLTFHEALELERLLRDRDTDNDSYVVELLAGLVAGPLSGADVVARLKGAEARPVEPDPAPEADWTTHDVWRTPFAARDGQTEPMITIHILTDGAQFKATTWYYPETGPGQTFETVPFPVDRSALLSAIVQLRQHDLPRAAVEWLDRLQGPHVVNGVDYYNSARAQGARYALGWDERRANHGGGSSDPRPSPLDPAGAQAASARDASDSATNPVALSLRARLALVELAHKIAVERRPLNPAADPAWTGDREADHLAFGASVGAFWLDGAHGELVAERLAAFAQVRGGLPPIASLTPAGVAWLIDQAIHLPVVQSTLEREQGAAGRAGHCYTPEVYATPWLATVPEAPGDDDALAATAGSAGDGGAQDADPWGRTPERVAADEALDAQVAQLTLGAADPAQLFAEFGVHVAETRDASDDDIGVVWLVDAAGHPVTTLTVDVSGELPESRVRALADLVAHQLNTVLG